MVAPRRSDPTPPTPAQVAEIQALWRSTLDALAKAWDAHADQSRSRGEEPDELDHSEAWAEVAAALRFGGPAAARQAITRWRSQWESGFADSVLIADLIAESEGRISPRNAGVYAMLAAGRERLRPEQLQTKNPPPAVAPAGEGRSSAGAHNTEVSPMRLRKFCGSYLKKEDAPTPMLLTISGVKEEQVGHGDDSDLRAVCYFAEVEKGLVLNVTAIRVLEEVFGTDDSDAYCGKKIVVFTDPDIEFGGKRVGGLRIRAPRNQAPVAARSAPAQTRQERQAPPPAAADEFPPAGEDMPF